MIKHPTVVLLFAKNHVSKFFNEIVLRGTRDTYKIANKRKEEVIDDNIILSSKFDLKVQKYSKILPVMYWVPKMH